MSRNPVGAFSELVWGRGEKQLPPIPSNGITSSCMEFSWIELNNTFNTLDHNGFMGKAVKTL
jgi:hypothetical protein